MKFLPILQNKDLVVIHKPSGWLTYADSRQQEAISCKFHLEYQLKKKLFPIHRIDKDTCGLLAYALRPESAKVYTELFRSRIVKKQYLALVHGCVPDQLVIDLPLQKNKEKTLEPALTEVKLLSVADYSFDGEPRQYSLVKVLPQTGRYHQIRRHLKMKGHPIVGDDEHGNSWNNEKFKAQFQLNRTLLSATGLDIPDQTAQKMIRLKTKPDSDFMQIVRALKFEGSFA